MSIGEVWRRQLQIGLETTYGVAVAATRIIYARDITITRERPPRLHEFDTGTRERIRAHTLQSIESGGGLTLDVSADEGLEWFALGFGAPTISTPAGGTLARQHLFTPLSTVPSATLEWQDGAKIWKATGVRVSKITISGSANGPNEMKVELFCKDLTTLSALTGALTARTPTFIEGWETRAFIDAFAGTPGTTQVGNTVLSWEVVFDFMLQRKYTADNTLAMARAILGPVAVTATFKLEAISATTTTEYAAWDAETNRLVRLDFGNNEQLEASPTNEVQTLTATGTVSGGTYTITYRGQTTSAIPYNAAIATVQAALEALPAIGPGNITVGGGAFPTTPLTFTGAGQLAGQDLPALVRDGALLTGGGTIAFSTTTPGVGYQRAVRIDLPGAWSTVDLTQEDAGTRVYEFGLQALYDTVNAFSARVLAITSRTALWT